MNEWNMEEQLMQMSVGEPNPKWRYRREITYSRHNRKVIVENNYVKNWRYVMCITPEYSKDNRNWAAVHYLNGDIELYNCRCEVIVQELAQVFRTTEGILHDRVEKAVSNSEARKPPLVVQEKMCFIRLKYRKVRKPHHRTVAYVVSQYIWLVEDIGNSHCQILFHKDAPPLKIRQSKASVERQMELAIQAQKQYLCEQAYWEMQNQIAEEALSADEVDWDSLIKK